MSDQASPPPSRRRNDSASDLALGGTLFGIGLGIGILTLDTFSHGTLSEVATLVFIMFIVVAGGFLLSGVFFMARAAGAKLGL